MTPRELEAHSKVAEQQRELTSGLYAGLQATLHNAHFKWPDKKGFTPAMFLGKNVRKSDTTPQWKRDLEHSRAALQLVKRIDPDSKEAKETVNQFQERAERARAATERGEPREVIEQIMSGVA